MSLHIAHLCTRIQHTCMSTQTLTSTMYTCIHTGAYLHIQVCLPPYIQCTDSQVCTRTEACTHMLCILIHSVKVASAQQKPAFGLSPLKDQNSIPVGVQDVQVTSLLSIFFLSFLCCSLRALESFPEIHTCCWPSAGLTQRGLHLQRPSVCLPAWPAQA